MIPTLAISVLLALQAAPGDEDVTIRLRWIAEPTKIDKPVALRITDAATWSTFWRTHTKSPSDGARIDFKSHMVLVIPDEISEGDTVLPASDGTGVRAWKSSETLKLRITLALTPAPKPGGKRKSVLTIVELPICAKAVEVSFKRGPVTAVADVLPAAEKLEAAPGIVTMKGTLSYTPVEGGTWLMTVDGKTFDLHGVAPGYKAGDKVEIQGREPKGGVCVHMCGPMFDIESMKLAP